MSPETDILIVGYPQERFAPEIRTAFRHWQVYSVASPHAIEGRRFRNAYFTEGATRLPGWSRVLGMLERGAVKIRGEVLPFSEYVEPTADLQDFEDAVLVSQLRRSRHAQDWV